MEKLSSGSKSTFFEPLISFMEAASFRPDGASSMVCTFLFSYIKSPLGQNESVENQSNMLSFQRKIEIIRKICSENQE